MRADRLLGLLKRPDPSASVPGINLNRAMSPPVFTPTHPLEETSEVPTHGFAESAK